MIGTAAIAALDCSLVFLEALLLDREGQSVPEIAAQVGLSRATAYLQVSTFLRGEFLQRLANGAPAGSI